MNIPLNFSPPHPWPAASAELPEFRHFRLVQRFNSLFLDKKIYPLPAPGKRKLLQAIGQLGSGIEFLVTGHVDGGQFAEMASLFVVPPPLQQTRSRDIGLLLRGFNQVPQQVDARPTSTSNSWPGSAGRASTCCAT